MSWINKLEKMKKELEETVVLERRKLLMEQEMISFKLGSLEKKIEDLSSLEDELDDLREEKNNIRKAEEERISKERFLEDIKKRIEKIKNTSYVLEKKSKTTEVKLALLDDPDPHCPICHKEMRYDEKVKIKNSLLEKDRTSLDINRMNLEQLDVLKEKKEQTEEELKEIKRKLMSKSVIFDKIGKIEKAIGETKQEARSLRELEKRDKEIKKSLRDKSYAEVAQKVLNEINKEIKNSL